MADEAFALSPISARAAMPGEADYEAIRDAFMETSRGRWFLNEYAKRNRNADTTMVLEAVARIEQSMAAQKQTVADAGLADAIAAIRQALDAARAGAAAAFDMAARDEVLVPIHKGVRIVREISWRWREIGGDGRICDLLDSQASAIEAASMQIAARDDAAALRAAFGLIETTLDELSGAEASAPSQTAAAPPPGATVDETPTVMPEETASAQWAQNAADAVAPGPGLPMTEEAEVPSETPGDMSVEARADPASAEAAGGDDVPYDDDLLDAIALEMGAPDIDEPEADTIAPFAPAIAEPEPVAAPEVIAETPDTSLFLEPDTAPDEPSEASLGASLLASGIVERPRLPGIDPLAPIRRMTQAEKIAFFS
ncbi:MAG TPA: hypothetical protein VHC94_11370 [Nitrobacter sp.]|nr:hypothetical protein [Nitrobacter sp.]